VQLSPRVRRKRKEVQQFRQVSLQLPDQGRIAGPPAEAKSLEGAPRPGGIVGPVDLLRSGFELGFLPPSHVFQDISHLVPPAALVPRARIDRLDRNWRTIQSSLSNELFLALGADVPPVDRAALAIEFREPPRVDKCYVSLPIKTGISEIQICGMNAAFTQIAAGLAGIKQPIQGGRQDIRIARF